MKLFRAIVLFSDRTYECKGFDYIVDAVQWADRKRDKVVFFALVLNSRGETVYETELA